jgi:hypothetical protein
MSMKRKIPYESRMLAFVTDSIPYYSDEKADWVSITKSQLSKKIGELQKENKNDEISELLNIASDPELKTNIELKNKSLRISLPAALKLMNFALKKNKTKTDIFKLILKKDLMKKIKYYSNLKIHNIEKINHLQNITNNWLKLKQDQPIEEYDLVYTYHIPDEDIKNKTIDFIINHIRTFFKSHKISARDINKFFSLGVFEELYDFGESNEIKVELFEKKPYLTFYLTVPPALVFTDSYNNYDDLLNEIPDSIKPLLNKIFGTEGFDENPDKRFFYLNEICLFKLRISFSSADKIILDDIDIQDEKFIEKILPKIVKNDGSNSNKVKKEIVELTAHGKYLEAKILQDMVNEEHSKKDLFEFYLKIIKELQSQVFSFSTPKNLLLLLDLLLHEKSAEKRIFSWDEK